MGADRGEDAGTNGANGLKRSRRESEYREKQRMHELLLDGSVRVEGDEGNETRHWRDGWNFGRVAAEASLEGKVPLNASHATNFAKYLGMTVLNEPPTIAGLDAENNVRIWAKLVDHGMRLDELQRMVVDSTKTAAVAVQMDEGIRALVTQIVTELLSESLSGE